MLKVIMVIVLYVALSHQAPNKFVLPLIDSETKVIENPTPVQSLGLAMHTEAARLAADYINNGTLGILTNTTLVLDSVSDHNTPAIGVSRTVEFAQQGHTLIVGNPFSAVAVQTGIVGTAYGIAQVSPLAGAAILADTNRYPYFSRLGSDTTEMAIVIKESIINYGSQSGRGWDKVAIIVEITDFTVDIAASFVSISQPEIDVLVYQSYLPGGVDIDAELNEIKKSGARIILGLVVNGWLDFLARCDSFGLVGDNYVYYGVPTLRSAPFSGETALSRGVLIPSPGSPTRTPEFGDLVNIWQSADPLEYPLAGPGTFPSPFAAKNFDMIITVAKAIDQMDQKGMLDGRRISAEEWSLTIRNISFSGASGIIEFDANGNFIDVLGIFYYSPENGWMLAGKYSQADGYEQLNDVVWYSNTTEIPDLDVRDPIDYWSCHSKERGYDESGKQVVLETPDGRDVDDIDYSYHCDLFIDCENISDESVDCSTNYYILFILFGILTGLLISLSLVLIVFVLVFGLCLRYSKVRHCSPVFLVLLLLSAIIGLCSIFAWFGKPHPVACAFQPWLLGIGVVSMISSMSVKNFRIWRIFRFPLKKTRVTDWELLIYWIITMIPAILILLVWTIISTPTAKLQTRDGEEHYVCSTGGFTGEPGGLIFFFILVFYSSIVLAGGAIISIAVQNAPSVFNESKLLKISIYNIGFLAIIIIPVYFVLVSFDPFSAWIIRTCAILYAFGATVFLQFVPMIIGIFVLDKGQDKKVKSLFASDSIL